MTKQGFIKWFKRGTLVLAIIPILIFLAFAGAVNLIDFNQYKPKIEEEVKQLTGRDLKIEGGIDVSVLPFVFNVGELYLKNPDGFKTENLLSIKEVQLELSLSDLLINKEISIVSLELIEPVLHLVKMAEGDNWTDLNLLTNGSTSETEGQAELTQQTAAEWLGSLEEHQVSLKPEESVQASAATNEFYWAFDSLVIRNGQIQLQDEVQGYSEKLSDINILTFDVVLGQPFDVNSDFIYQNSLSEKTNDFHLSGTLEINRQFKSWVLTDWNGVFKLRLPEDKNVPEVRLTTIGERLSLDFDTLDIQVVKGQFSGLDAHLNSSFSGKFGRNIQLEGRAEIRNLSFKNWSYYLGIAMPEFLEQTVEGDGNGEFDWQWDGEKLLLNPLTLKVNVDESKGAE